MKVRIDATSQVVEVVLAAGLPHVPRHIEVEKNQRRTDLQRSPHATHTVEGGDLAGEHGNAAYPG